MDIRGCQIFLKLSETAHFGRTAALCNLSPSAVSRYLMRIEREVGQRLVLRDNRKVQLTPAGRRFLVYARKTLADWQQLRSDLDTKQSGPAGEVTVFGSVTASYSVLAHILPNMRSSYPRVEIKLRTGDQAEGLERVASGAEDAAIIAKPVTLPSKLKFLPLRETPLVLIGPRTPSVLTQSIDQCLAEEIEPDWGQIPMVLAERGLAREAVLQCLATRNKQPNIYAQVAGHEAVVSMVSLGFGVAVVPELVIEHSPERETIRALPWLDNLSPFSLGLCVVAERLDDPLLKAFWHCAADTYPQ
jgi:LysR family positive regulator for ilvC